MTAPPKATSPPFDHPEDAAGLPRKGKSKGKKVDGTAAFMVCSESHAELP